MEEENKGSFLSNGLSIDEAKISILVLVFIFVSGYAIYQYHIAQDITSNWLEFLKVLVYAIAGVNGINGVANIVSNLPKTNTTQQNITNNIPKL